MKSKRKVPIGLQHALTGSHPTVRDLADAAREVEPESVSALTGDGKLVTVIDRVPREGERGWYLDNDKALDHAMERVLDIGRSSEGEYGWPATDIERGTASLRVVTVETHAEPEQCALATVEDLRAGVKRAFLDECAQVYEGNKPTTDPVPPEDVVGELRAYAAKSRGVVIQSYTFTCWADEIERAIKRAGGGVP